MELDIGRFQCVCRQSRLHRHGGAPLGGNACMTRVLARKASVNLREADRQGDGQNSCDVPAESFEKQEKDGQAANL